jgi:hypothetical protein
MIDLSSMVDIPFGNIITAATAVLAVVIANRLSYRSSYNERVWDLRRETYGIILSQLAILERICDGIDEAVNERSYEEYWNTKGRERDDARISECMGAMQKRFSDDYLILTDEFIDAYNKLMSDMRSDPYDYDPPSEHDDFSKAIRENRPLLLALARREMSIKTRWWRPFT